MFSDLTVPYAICRWWVFAYFDSLYRDIKINDHDREFRWIIYCD